MNDLEPGPREYLDTQKRAFAQTFQWGGALFERIASDGATVTYVRRLSEHLSVVRALLPVAIQEGFGTAPEILIACVSGQVKARDLEQARRELYRADRRLDLDLVFVVDAESGLEDRLARLPGRWGQWIPWSPIPAFAPLKTQLTLHLPHFDLYEEKNPVRGRQIIGRQAETQELTSRIESSACVGIFGLRKMGKTSVVRAATDQLDPVSKGLSLAFATEVDDEEIQPRVLVAWLDLQLVYDRSEKRLYDALHESLKSRFELAKVGVRPKPAVGSLGQIDEILRVALKYTAIPICIVLDEYDYLFEGSGGQPPIPGTAELLRMLRGWGQQTNRLSLVVIGRDPSFLEAPELGGFPNPFLNWAVSTWIRPLKQREAPELLRHLGKRVGLRIGAETARIALEETGGHPLLHRQFGSTLLALSKPRRRDPEGKVDTDPFASEAIEPFRQRDSVRSIFREIVHLLRNSYPDSYQMLLRASFGEGIAEAIKAYGGNSSRGARQLRHFGLILESGSELRVPQGLVAYIRETEHNPNKPPTSLSARNQSAPSRSPGIKAKPTTPEVFVKIRRQHPQPELAQGIKGFGKLPPLEELMKSQGSKGGGGENKS